MRRINQCIKCFSATTTRSNPILSTYNNPQTRTPSNLLHNLIFSPVRNLYLSPSYAFKLFIDAENTYAFSLLPPLTTPEPLPVATNPIKTIEEFEHFLAKNWRSSRPEDVVLGFETVKNFCVEHKINLSDPRFDNLVDGLMDNCDKLTDDQLLRLLHLLAEFPECEGLNSHNFQDVWTCLDDICCWKMGSWNVEKMFVFANAWNKLHLGRISDYVFEVLDKTSIKPHRYSKTMLLYFFFYMNVARRMPVKFEFEHVIAKRIHEFGVEELSIIAMGYFKTKSRIKLMPILQAMIDSVKNNCGTINEISLVALLKAIRLTQNLDSVTSVASMLDKLTPHIPKLATVTCVHVALVGTGLQLKHLPTQNLCIQKIASDIENIRLKDIERTLLVSSMFDIDTTPSIYEKSFKELHKASRRPEFVQYNRCLPCALNYLSLRNIYSYDLMSQLLDEEFIVENFGKGSKTLPRELLSLDYCIEIECPDYSGNRLSPTRRYKSVKWHLEWTPEHDPSKKLSLGDKIYLDVLNHVVEIVGDERHIRHDHVLPHFSKPDMILCRNRASGEFVEPFGFVNYVLGDVKRPFHQDKYEWFAVVVLSPNQSIKGEDKPLGAFLMKERQLSVIGYNPILVLWSEFGHLSSSEKSVHIRKKLSL